MPVSDLTNEQANDTTESDLLAGTCLKRKQKWTMIYNGQKDCVYLQSPLNHYLSTDKYGRLQCDTDDIDDDCCFQLEYSSTGQWAFKSLTYGMYLGGDHDQLHCFCKAPQWWSPHLALHPQVIRTKGCARSLFDTCILLSNADQFEACATKVLREIRRRRNPYR